MARKEFDAAAAGVAQKEAFRIEEIGDQTIETVSADVGVGDKFAIEAFMAEKVRVVIQDTTERTASRVVPLWVNGRAQFFIRGVPIWVRRCYVARLAQMRETSYQQDLDPRLGESMNTLYPHSGLTYPFTVLEDPNPRGRAWLEALLAQEE